MSPRVIYLPLERQEERYSWDLQADMEARLDQRGVPYVVVLGTALREDGAIQMGRVLDAHGRCHWSLTQTAEVVRMLEGGAIGGGDVIFSEDLFHPGYEALPYILSQLPRARRPKVYTRNLAQSVDPDDFTFEWCGWMRHFEHLVDETVNGILMASTEMGWHMRVGMLNRARLYVTGLPFDKFRVRSRIPVPKPLSERTRRVVYTSRLDREKQPNLFLDLIEKSDFAARGYTFAILSGARELRSNDSSIVARALRLQRRGLLQVYVGLDKLAYYALLADSQVQFNCARQDWVSNTAMEASALGVPSLAPAFRSFPETFNNSPRHLFVPWSLEDAVAKLDHLLSTLDDGEVSYVADTQHQSLDRTIDVLLGRGERWRYRGPRREPAWEVLRHD